MTHKARIIRTLVLSLIGLGIGMGIALYQIKSQPAAVVVKKSPAQQASSQEAGQPMAGVQLGGDFALTDHNGKAISAQDYAGKLKLIYFGFTYCPAICPTELQKISAALEMLDNEDAQRIQPLFITVDPQRDTVEVMREYVKLFHPSLIGLTGTPEQIEKVKSDYRVFSSIVQDENLSDYTVDHSSFIYLMNEENKPLAIFRIEDGADMVAAEIRKALKGDH